MDDALVVSDLQFTHHSQFSVLLPHPLQFNAVLLKQAFLTNIGCHLLLYLGSSISISVAEPFIVRLLGCLLHATKLSSAYLALVLRRKLFSRGNDHLAA
jgi:hypothetical protein